MAEKTASARTHLSMGESKEPCTAAHTQSTPSGCCLEIQALPGPLGRDCIVRCPRRVVSGNSILDLASPVGAGRSRDPGRAALGSCRPLCRTCLGLKTHLCAFLDCGRGQVLVRFGWSLLGLFCGAEAHAPKFTGYLGLSLLGADCQL